jgi:hypothetical protein
MPTQFFAFHNISRSSYLSKPYHRGQQASYFMRNIPALQSYFMASRPHTLYLRHLLATFKTVLGLQPGEIISYFS